MEDIIKQVGRARRRLGVQRFVNALGWCTFATLAVALALIVLGRFWPLGVADWILVAGAVAVGLLAAGVWAVAMGRGSIDAAIEIDHLFGLKERVSSTLALSEAERQTDVGRALVEDAVRRVKRIDVAGRMSVFPGRSLLLPIAPGLLVVLVAMAITPAVVENPATADEAAAVKRQVKKSSKTLSRKLAEQRKKADKEGLKDAEHLFKILEKRAQELAAKNKGDRKEALVKLNDLARQIRKRREQQGGAEKVKQQLSRLKCPKQGPADGLAKAIRKGDFKKALEELNKLKKQLEDGKLDEKKRKELAEQLDQMKEKAQKLAEAHRQALEDLQNQADKARQSGRNAEADDLEQQIDKLRQQLPQMQQLDKLAQKMGQCSKCLRDGQLKEAGEAMEALEAELGDLQRQLDELDMLDEALDQVAQCCQGCMGCQAGGEGERPGQGMGAGRGQGDRPEERDATAFRDSQVRQKVTPGSITVVDLVEGPNKKGQVTEAIKEQFEAATHESADPLTDQKMPRQHRRHARQYFDRFRKSMIDD